MICIKYCCFNPVPWLYHNSNPESRKNVKNQTRMKCWKNWKEERDTDLRVLDEDSWLMIGKSIDDRSEYDNIWMK